MIRTMILSFALCCSTVGVARGQAPKAVPDIAIEQRLNEQVPLDLIFCDEAGAAVPLRKFFGDRPVILVLAYYRCPRLCSLVLNHLTGSMQKLDYRIGEDFTVVTVSIDPRETPDMAAAKKAAYVEHFGDPAAEKAWHFLTGEEANIKQLADAVGFGYAYDPKQDQYAHSSGIMVLTSEGRIARYYFGISYPARDLRYGLEDASAGTIGSPISRPVRLLCFSYDPTTGKYTLMTLRLIRIGGALTVLGLGVFLLWSWRRVNREGEAPAEPNERGSAGASPSQSDGDLS